jgi:hypothetical protein
MADALYLSLWFPSFREVEMMPRMLSVLRLFPYSAAKPGIGAVAVYPLDFGNAPVYSQGFDFRAAPERAVALAGEFLHDDYAYEFEAEWDLWVPSEENGDWRVDASEVRFIAHGTAFDHGAFQQNGHIQIDFGPDLPFLQGEIEFTPDVEARIKSNVQRLVSFTNAIEKNCGITGRVLWSESEENLAQKLIARLQKIH